MKSDDNKEGIADAVKAMFEAAEKEDWDEAASAFSDAQRLSDDDSEEPDEPDKGDEGKSKGKPLAALIFGKKD
jgi:hypothetical protein